MKFRGLLGAAVALLSTAAAHECWLMPERFSLRAGESTGLTLAIGMNFQGEVRPWNPARVGSLRRLGPDGTADLAAGFKGQEVLPVTVPGAGWHVVAYDSKPSTITLPADEFLAYLKEEGLEEVIAARAQAGESGTPGRERYRRCNKTLLHTAGDDSGFDRRTGQALELVPVDNPQAVVAGGTFRVRVWLRGAPLANAAVRAWQRRGNDTRVLDGRTDAGGEVSFVLPGTGTWMFSTVHMERVQEANLDWESHWGNLTLAVGRP